MRFSFFVSTLFILVSLFMTCATAKDSLEQINQINQRNFTLYQQQQQQQQRQQDQTILYHLNTPPASAIAVDNIALKRRQLLLVDSASTTSSKDPIFALVIFVALSSLMF